MTRSQQFGLLTSDNMSSLSNPTWGLVISCPATSDVFTGVLLMALFPLSSVIHIGPRATDSFLFCLSNIDWASALCWVLGIALHLGDRNCLHGEGSMLAAQHAPAGASEPALPGGITFVQRGPTLPAQACDQIITAELGPQLPLP